MKAYRTRKDNNSLATLDKARKIITGEDAPITAEIVEPKKGPPPIDPKMMKLEKGAPPVQKSNRTPPILNEKDGKKQPHNEIVMMKQMMDAARRKAKAGGLDEFQAAENELQKFEEKGIDNVGVVRRLWDKYREQKKITQP